MNGTGTGIFDMIPVTRQVSAKVFKFIKNFAFLSRDYFSFYNRTKSNFDCTVLEADRLPRSVKRVAEFLSTA